MICCVLGITDFVRYGTDVEVHIIRLYIKSTRIDWHGVRYPVAIIRIHNLKAGHHMDDCGVAGCLASVVFDYCEVHGVVANRCVCVRGRRRVHCCIGSVSELPSRFIDASG